MAIAPDVLCYIKLPDKLEDGAYDQFGNKAGPGVPVRLVLNALPNPVAPPWQAWGVFDQPLAPGQFGFLMFENVQGSATPGAAFTEWDPSTNTPDFAEDRLLVLYSVQRSPGAARVIGRNDSTRPVRAAAGLLFVPPAAAQGPGAPGQAAPAASGTPPAPAAGPAPAGAPPAAAAPGAPGTARQAVAPDIDSKPAAGRGRQAGRRAR